MRKGSFTPEGVRFAPLMASAENSVGCFDAARSPMTVSYTHLVELPGDLFEEEDTRTITTWLKDEIDDGDYAAMFFGTKTKYVDADSSATMPVNYWLLNPSKDGCFKSVWTDGDNASKPYNTETVESGEWTSDEWSLYTTVITPTSITGYYNGVEVCSDEKTKTTTDFGTCLLYTSQ